MKKILFRANPNENPLYNAYIVNIILLFPGRIIHMELLNMYFFCLIFCTFALLVLSYCIFCNKAIKKSERIKFYITNLYLIVLFVVEFTGNFLNGKENIDTCLRIIKFLNYAMMPFIAILFSRQIYSDKTLEGIMFCILLLHSLFQFISIFTGWGFFVDSDHYYHHGNLFFIYYVVVFLSFLYVSLNFMLMEKTFRKRLFLSVGMVYLVVIAGIFVQEAFRQWEIKTVMLSLTLAILLLYIQHMSLNTNKTLVSLDNTEKELKTDPMTRLLNRYAFNQTLARQNGLLSLDMDTVIFAFDINGLKQTNDRFGHEAGDEMIKATADYIFDVFSSYGLCFRTGGDEFIAILKMEKGTQRELLKKFRQLTVSHQGVRISGFTVSVGYAFAVDYPALTFESLINKADENMYTIKNQYYQKQAGA